MAVTVTLLNQLAELSTLPQFLLKHWLMLFKTRMRNNFVHRQQVFFILYLTAQ